LPVVIACFTKCLIVTKKFVTKWQKGCLNEKVLLLLVEICLIEAKFLPFFS